MNLSFLRSRLRGEVVAPEETAPLIAEGSAVDVVTAPPADRHIPTASVPGAMVREVQEEPVVLDFSAEEETLRAVVAAIKAEVPVVVAPPSVAPPPESKTENTGTGSDPIPEPVVEAVPAEEAPATVDQTRDVPVATQSAPLTGPKVAQVDLPEAPIGAPSPVAPITAETSSVATIDEPLPAPDPEPQVEGALASETLADAPPAQDVATSADQKEIVTDRADAEPEFALELPTGTVAEPAQASAPTVADPVKTAPEPAPALAAEPQTAPEPESEPEPEPEIEQATIEPATEAAIAALLPGSLTPVESDELLRARIASAEAEIEEDATPQIEGPRRRRLGLKGLFAGRSSAAAPRQLPAARALARAIYAPLPLVIVGSWFGGGIAFLGLVTVALFAVLSLPLTEAARREANTDSGFPLTGLAARTLPFAYVVSLAIVLVNLASIGQAGLTGWLFTTLGFGLWTMLGPVRLARAECVLRAKNMRVRSEGVFCTLLMGHRGAAERLVIPRFAATSDDPHTAEPGESFWAFLPRSIAGSFVSGHAMTELLMKPSLGRKRAYVHPFLIHICIWAALIFVVGVSFGPIAVPTLGAIAVTAHIALALDDYIARYGLQRRKLGHGKYEPLGPQHHWSAPEIARGFGRASRIAARTEPGPVLPRPLPLMAVMALVPPLWASEMDTRVTAMIKVARDAARPVVTAARPVARSGEAAHQRLAARPRF